MKKLILLIILFLPNLFAQDLATGSIRVEIRGFESSEGNVRIALFNSSESYEKTGKPFRALELKIDKKTVFHTFEDIPLGEYAIKLFHDENNNKELDTGLFGIPTEDYAFSNNAKGFMGPATYEAAKFNLDKKNIIQKLTIN